MSSSSPPDSCQNDVLASLLPWGIIAEYSSFEDVLHTRLACRAFLEAIGNGLSLTFCSNYLSHCLTERNLYLIADLRQENDWKDSVTQDVSKNLLYLLQPSTIKNDSSNTTTSFLDRLLRVLRVVQCLPKQLVVAFSANYGRHCLPLEWDEDQQTSILQRFPACQRSNCSTCQVEPLVKRSNPTMNNTATTTNHIDDHLELCNNQDVPIDLQSYNTMCIPNLPVDLTCPHCQRTDQRTLVLSECSYQSEIAATRPSHVDLTWTPKRMDTSSVGDTKEEDSEPHSQQAGILVQAPSNKRHKTESSSSEEVATPRPPPFPPVAYDDMAIPIRHEPLRVKEDCKHAMTIHCTNCQQFALLAPAGICWNLNSRCLQRGLHLENGSILGGALVRTQCSLINCHSSIRCYDCTHQTWHAAYEGGVPVRHPTSQCSTCQQDYCQEHAWLSTVCHHW